MYWIFVVGFLSWGSTEMLIFETKDTCEDFRYRFIDALDVYEPHQNRILCIPAELKGSLGLSN